MPIIIGGYDMIGSILGAASGLAKGIIGGIKAAKARRQQAKIINNAKQRNEAQFTNDYYGDYMERSDAQAVMKRVRDTMRNNNKVTTASAAVTGATPEAVAAQKAAANQTVADAASNLQANADAYKTNAKNTYVAQNNALDQAQLQQAATTEQGYSNMAASGISSAADAIGNSDAVKALDAKLTNKYNTVWNK